MSWDKIWDEAFVAEIAAVEEKSGTNPTDWRVSGRATVKNPDRENKAWWDENGKQMFYDFIGAWSQSGFEIWTTPEGLPGVELGFNIMLGEVPVKAFADLIAVNSVGELCVVDFKTGSYTPDSSMQLGIYAVCMEKTFGLRPTRGYYYSARKAAFLESEGLDRWTIPVLTEMFSQFQRGLDADIFLPNIGMSCSTCGVKEYCYAVGGQLSQIYDPLAQIK